MPNLYSAIFHLFVILGNFFCTFFYTFCTFFDTYNFLPKGSYANVANECLLAYTFFIYKFEPLSLNCSTCSTGVGLTVYSLVAMA